MQEDQVVCTNAQVVSDLGPQGGPAGFVHVKGLFGDEVGGGREFGFRDPQTQVVVAGALANGQEVGAPAVSCPQDQVPGGRCQRVRSLAWSVVSDRKMMGTLREAAAKNARLRNLGMYPVSKMTLGLMAASVLRMSQTEGPWGPLMSGCFSLLRKVDV